MERRSPEPPLGVPQLVRGGRSGRLRRFPRDQDVIPLTLYPFSPYAYVEEKSISEMGQGAEGPLSL